MFGRVSVCLLVVATVSFPLMGCSADGPPSSQPSNSISREASPRGSQLCILNGTDKTIPMVREMGPFRSGDHHPDPAGPLAPGAKWCTNGYNGVTWPDMDVAAQILFDENGTDRSNWGAYNPWAGDAGIKWGNGDEDSLTQFIISFTPQISWETDATFPENTQPNHDYHIRRLDDTEFFKEWLVTVRS